MPRTAVHIAEPQIATTPKITVCNNPKTKACGAETIYQGLINEARKLNIKVVVEPAKCGCSGSCENGAFLSFPHMGVFYHKVKEGHIETILKETVQKGKLVFPLLRLNPLQSIRGDLIWEKATGCIMTMDSSYCMVEVAEYLIKFHYDESCGKCVPCRLGVQKLADLIEAVRCGQAPANAIQEMEGLIKLMMQAPYCSFAGKVSHIILSILSQFKEEFEAHIKEKRCPTGACKIL
jgi:NADH:ubiquinone oxidoreductase, NADH-binding (51 kD) subunit